MKSPFPHSAGFKRYYTEDYYFKSVFGEKTARLPIDAGFTCPNIDGTKGIGGCIYCSGRGSGDFSAESAFSVTEQLAQMREARSSKWEVKNYIAYFQAHTNTYAPPEKLRALFDEALTFPGVCGIYIATRPDCLDGGIISLLGEYSEKTKLSVELGLQTCNDVTAGIINRCHTYSDFLCGYQALKDVGIRVCVHIINGLPGENKDDMLYTVRETAKLRPDGIKIHLLHILRGTAAEDMLREGKIIPLTLDEYVDIVCDQLAILPPDTVIERITGDGKKNDLVAPLWSLKKFVVLNSIDKEMLRRDSFQGIKYYPGE
ncbi:MAG: TIGR01212 family radical SAM protein [Oscillospiraceae bacterium]|nr:TIGR01212 family radical SAM protein [Oscillospiraceae bacterium]